MYSRYLIHQERKLRSSLIVMGCGIFGGILYPLLAGEFDRGLWPFLNALLIGIFCASFVIIHELLIERGRRGRMGFIQTVLWTTMKYVLVFGLIIAVVMITSIPIEKNISYSEYLGSGLFSDFFFHGDFNIILIYALVITFLVVFTRQLSRKLGQNVLFSMAIGKFHTPRSEERIFLFMDLTNSVKLGERLDLFNYTRFINDFFYDLTGPILSTRGEIYQYVGDMVIVSWPVKKGLEKANCVRCHFLSKMEINSRREYYLRQYGVIPQFTSGLHCGSVLTGEIGFIRSEIVHNGEVLFETGKLEKACARYDADIIIAQKLMERLELPLVYTYRPLGILSFSVDKKMAIGSIAENMHVGEQIQSQIVT